MNEDHTATGGNWRTYAYIGYAVIFLTFGVLGGWAFMVKVDQAAAGQGVVIVESKRKAVQHLEGGIVKDVLVKEGQIVRAGDTLVRLDPTQPMANLEMLRNQHAALLALDARLRSEQGDLDHIAWPKTLLDEKNNSQVARIMADQQAQFEERRASLTGQLNILEARVEQLRSQIDGLRTEKASSEEQIRFINQELAGLRYLRERELIPVTRVLAMERERTRLEGQIGRLAADIARTEASIGETQLQISQIRQKFREDVASQLMENGQRLAEVAEKITVARDVLSRLNVIAPESGMVQGVKVYGSGQVVRPGEQLMELVPAEDRLLVEARFAPQDIDGIHEGQKAELRFEALQALKPPIITGQLESVSRDRLVDASTGQPYYLAVIRLDANDIPPELRDKIRAGMGVEVLALRGARTFADYLLSPLANALRKSFIHH
ncbi:HlyD family type I secretion periplasmic adaptor subunit [Camelimonas abortus]|uniref:Membrane fusion protein (MFP) family protein n=1 Tax=Camelimonas abortus TaxID=1017184 RepID=A0ABV7LHT3_9HYPH